MIALLPVSLIYGAIVATKNSFYDRGVLKSRKLKWPVVSIGNLSTGGSGKTPFVIALIHALRKHGYECDVLSRGYRRRTKGALAVDANGTTDQYGDEPLMIARATGAPVFVAETRYAAGLLAESHDAQNERIHLLDDGFQHRRLARTMDIVLLSPQDLDDDLLPAGRLREPISSLYRVDEIAVNDDFLVPRSAERKGVIRYRRKLNLEHAPKPIAFCGIARPERFFHDINHYGIATLYDIAYPDHHRYSDKDVAYLLQIKQQYGAASFLTTQKDAVRFSAEQLARMQPFYVAELVIEFEDPDRVVSAVLSTIAAHGGHA